MGLVGRPCVNLGCCLKGMQNKLWTLLWSYKQKCSSFFQSQNKWIWEPRSGRRWGWLLSLLSLINQIIQIRFVPCHQNFGCRSLNAVNCQENNAFTRKYSNVLTEIKLLLFLVSTLLFSSAAGWLFPLLSMYQTISVLLIIYIVVVTHKCWIPLSYFLANL